MLAFATVAVMAGCRDTVPASQSQPVASADQSAAAAPEYREVTLPEGTKLSLELQSAVGSATSHVEQPVRATLGRGVFIHDREVLPAGTEVAGTVTDAERSGRVRGRARVAFRFDTLNHDSTQYRIGTESITRVARATKAKDATKIGIGAGAGAALGALLGGGGGAAKGAALGGAAGSGVVLATRGDEVYLGPGASVVTRLTAPVTILTGVGSRTLRRTN
jgi:hypothetical protein